MVTAASFSILTFYFCCRKMLFLLLFSTPLLTTGQESVCTRTVSAMQTYEYYALVGYTSQYDCGLWGWSTCYRIRNTPHLQYGSNLVYHREVYCCSGYHRVAGECLPICPDCPESHFCLAPYFCACPETWSGGGCTEPPQSVELIATRPHSLQFSWSPPPGLVATLYIVLFQYKTYRVDPSSDLVVELNSLATYTMYTCCVAAKTTSGSSRVSCATQRTLEGAPRDSPRNVVLTALNSTAIHIQWDGPLIPNGVIIHYTVYIAGYPQLTVNATTSDGSQETSVGSFSSDQRLIVRLSASTTAGEGPLTSPRSVTTHEAVPGPVENLNVIAIDANTFRVIWDPPTYSNGDLTGYRVSVTNLINVTETTHPVTPHLHQLIIDRGISPYVRYSVKVMASTAAGFGNPVEVTLYSQEGTPQSSPPNVTSSRNSPTTASVVWDDISLEELRGWLVVYEIGYGITMSGDHQCPANDSFTYNETLSVDSEGQYQLTGLDPGLQYCLRVAGRTSAGVGPFSHTFTPWYVNSVFTVKLHKENCSEWIVVEPEQIVQDLSTALSDGIELTCNCSFPSDHIADGQLTCHNDILIFQGRIISTTEWNSTDLMEYFKQWLSGDPTVIVQGEELSLVKEEMFTESEKHVVEWVAGATAGVVAVIILGGVLIIILVTWRKHRSESSRACKTHNILGHRCTSATTHNASAAEPLKSLPKPLTKGPNPQNPSKLPLQPPKNRPIPRVNKPGRQVPKRQNTPPQCETIVNTENVYEDPDIMGAKSGTTSIENMGYYGLSTRKAKTLQKVSDTQK